MMRRTELKRNTPLQSKPKRKKEPKEKKPALPWKPTFPKQKKQSLEFPQSVKNIVRERSGGMCERCKCRPLMEYHHCIFRSNKRDCKPTLDNCLGLCIWCHKEDADSAHKSKETREWCVQEAKRLAEVT